MAWALACVRLGLQRAAGDAARPRRAGRWVRASARRWGRGAAYVDTDGGGHGEGWRARACGCERAGRESPMAGGPGRRRVMVR